MQTHSEDCEHTHTHTRALNKSQTQLSPAGSFAMERCAGGWTGSFNDGESTHFPSCMTQKHTLTHMLERTPLSFIFLSSTNGAMEQPSLQLHPCLSQPVPSPEPQPSSPLFPLCSSPLSSSLPTPPSFCPHKLLTHPLYSSSLRPHPAPLLLCSRRYSTILLSLLLFVR